MLIFLNSDNDDHYSHAQILTQNTLISIIPTTPQSASPTSNITRTSRTPSICINMPSSAPSDLTKLVQMDNLLLLTASGPIPFPALAGLIDTMIYDDNNNLCSAIESEKSKINNKTIRSKGAKIDDKNMEKNTCNTPIPPDNKSITLPNADKNIISQITSTQQPPASSTYY